MPTKSLPQNDSVTADSTVRPPARPYSSPDNAFAGRPLPGPFKMPPAPQTPDVVAGATPVKTGESKNTMGG
jgi:hypothetical protein